MKLRIKCSFDIDTEDATPEEQQSVELAGAQLRETLEAIFVTYLVNSGLRFTLIDDTEEGEEWKG